MAVFGAEVMVGVAVRFVPFVPHNSVPVGSGFGQYDADHEPPSRWHLGVALGVGALRTLQLGVCIYPVGVGACDFRFVTRQLYASLSLVHTGPKLVAAVHVGEDSWSSSVVHVGLKV
jgi:hypothetical protein